MVNYGGAGVTVTVNPSGNGATDTANIQAALNAAAGGTVLLGSGTFGPITATLTPAAPVAANLQGTAIEGTGWGTVITGDQAVVSPLFAMPGTTQGKFDIRNLRLEMSGAADGGTAIDISYFINSVISNVSIDKGATNHFNVGISGEQTGTEYNVISDSRISVTGTGAKCISLSSNSNSNVIRNCRLIMGSDSGARAVYLNAHSNTVDHVDVESGGGTAVYLDASAHATTLLNVYSEANNYGLQMAAGVIAPTVLGGTFQSSTTQNIQDSGAISPVLLGTWPNSGNTVSGNLFPEGNPAPADQNLLAWSFDPASGASNSSLPASGVVQLIRVVVRTTISVTNVLAEVAVLGTGFTANENFAGLYNSSGTLIGTTADQASAWGSTGLKTMALSGGPFTLTPGNYYVALLQNGSANVAFLRGGGVGGESQVLNAGLTASTARFATSGSGVTSLGAITMSSNTLASVGFWAGLS